MDLLDPGVLSTLIEGELGVTGAVTQVSAALFGRSSAYGSARWNLPVSGLNCLKKETSMDVILL